MRIKIFKGRQYFLFLNALIIKGGGAGGIKPEPIISSKLTKHQEGLKHFGFESKL